MTPIDPRSILARAKGPFRIGRVPCSPARVREVLAAVPASSSWFLAGDATAVLISWDEPGHGGALRLHSLAGVRSWSGRHGDLIGVLRKSARAVTAGHRIPRVGGTDIANRDGEAMRRALVKRLGREWKYVKSYTCVATLTALADLDLCDVDSLADAVADLPECGGMLDP